MAYMKVTKYKNNPEKAPSTEVIMRMTQRINRSQKNSDKAGSQYEGFSQKSTSPKNQKVDEGKDSSVDKDNPIVALEPEDHMKQGSAFLPSKKQSNIIGQEENPLQKQSLYYQEKAYFAQREQEQLLKAEEYHVVKTKDFNVYGRLRQDKPFVKATQKSQISSELNEKFITTELIADRRVKISSMNQRIYIGAPSVEEVRKQGQHQMILSAINKKQTFGELINQANSMVTSVLHDPLKRSLNILPSKCIFGNVRAGVGYEIMITLKNEDNLAQRIAIRPTFDKRIKASQEEVGHIAPGLLKKIKISITSSEEDSGQIKEDVQIMTKTDIYKIPVEANILQEQAYEDALKENQAIHQGAGFHNSRVREKLNQSITQGRKKEWMKSIEQWDQNVDGQKGQDRKVEDIVKTWMETTNSESKLPDLPQIGKRPFQVDPKKTLDEQVKSQQRSNMSEQDEDQQTYKSTSKHK